MRTLTEISHQDGDASPVVYPAYPDTEVDVRSREAIRSWLEAKAAEAVETRLCDRAFRRLLVRGRRWVHFPVPLSITVLPPVLGALTVIGKEPAGAGPLAVGMNSILIGWVAPG